ncbi:AAA family ATPase [Marinibacterium profundimaris]|uniref:Bacterial transcriptional activator domain-containing protein n=1 Tax=Marinibacterium profundimaris TaxID=1679460 RepID=A0A225NJD7_9RHOB|nr:AAA family ATPase [Marinibacterium profundimaris]OWU69007.1 hypothetical protein ATO3_23135 [Marinibacterium profundimaris]
MRENGEFWLEALGGLALARGGAEVPLSARKARVLLGLLAAARRRTLPRARAAALLWEASDAAQARISLRQALAQIRRAGGAGWIEGDGDVLRLCGAVRTDLDAFSDALARNDPAEAARLYRGPFLDGLEAGDATGTDLGQAIHAERARLAGLARDAVMRSLDRAGEGPEAVPLAHQLLALDPLNEAAHRRLMQIDAARGMKGAALARFEALETALRRDLDVAPEAETRALHDRIRRGAPTVPPVAAVHVKQPAGTPPGDAYLLLGFETGREPAAKAFGDAAVAEGGRPDAAGPGELAFVFENIALRDVAQRALRLADVAGAGLSLGLVPAAGDGETPAQALVRARRIAAMAEGGEVLLATELASRLGLAAEPGARAVPLRPDAIRLRPAPPIIGREAELAQIDAAIAAAQGGNTSLAIHLSGEAGIGKSRLATEIRARCAAVGMVTTSAGFEAFSPGSHHIAQRLVAGLSVGPVPDPEAGPMERAVWSWLTGPDVGPEVELRMSALGPEEQRRRILDVLSDTLHRASAERGLLIVIEDCHWRPVGSGALILELLNRLAESPVVLLMTERPHPGSLDHRLAVRAQTGLTRIALAPLPETAARDLVRAFAPDFAAPEKAIAHARGHPLFLLRLLESGWREGALPTTVTELVQEQIERLPEAERAALRRAAILGAAFDPGDAAAVFPESVRLRPSGDLLHETEAGLAFGHDLVHRAIYETISPATREAWHARAAAHFRGRDPILWADHALQAADDAEAGHAACAATNAMFAARRFSAAYIYLEAGLARDGDPEASAELYSCRAGIRRVRGDMAGALEDYRTAHARAIRDETRAAMLCRQALVLHRLGRGEEADRALDAAEQIADAIGLTGRGRAEIHEQRGNRAFVRGDQAACMAHHRAALAAAEATGDPRGIARGHGGIGDAAYAAGHFVTACRHFGEAIDTAERAGLGLVREEYLFMRAFSQFFAAPGPYAHLLADIAVDSAIQCGAARTEMLAREIRAEMRLADGDVAGLEEDMAAVEALVAVQGESRFSRDVETLQAFLALRRGDLGAARARLAPLRPGAEEDAYVGGTILGLAVLCAADRAERDAALAAGLACIVRGSLSHSVIWFHACVLERAMQDGDRALAERHAAAMRALAAEEPCELATLYARAAELAFRPKLAQERAAHGAALRAARLSDIAEVMEKVAGRVPG